MLIEIAVSVLLSGSLIYAFYKWATVNKDYFVKRNIKHMEPKFLIGDTTQFFMKQYTPGEFFDMIYYRYPKEKLVGFFDMRVPVYLLRDIDYIQKICIKNFDSFEDHFGFVSSESDALFGYSLLMLEGKEWRDMRATVSPAFTGSKMRHMFELVVDCADDMTKYLSEESKQGKLIRWEMKELFSRYTSDVIASCAFGLKTNSLRDPSNEFFTLGKGPLNFSSPQMGLRLLVIRLLPKLMRALDFQLFPLYVRKFFKSMVIDTMAERKKRNIFRPDMINILMQVRDGSLNYQKEETNNDDTGFATTQESNIGKVQIKRTWNDDQIISQCFAFFFAGFETSATLLSFVSYELAIHQDIQKKLYEEIREINKQLNGIRLTYDTLSKMKYLDQVISEGLRKWNPALYTNRKCTKDYEFDLDGRTLFIGKGRQIWIPIHSIHHDPEIYENPEQFDPERFNDENKLKIKPGSYIPFGVGPRNCIGSRFALMEIKALFFYLLLNFNIQPYEETQIPLKIANSSAFFITEKGIHLEFKPRE